MSEQEKNTAAPTEDAQPEQQAQAEDMQPQTPEKEESAVLEQEADALEEAIARVQELEDALKTQQEDVKKQLQDLHLRNQAELQNVRRRAEQDVEKAHNFALEKFAKELLEIIDNLERAIASKPADIDESSKAMFDGVELTYKSLISTVNKFGISAVGEVGDVFNPDLHQAIAMNPTEGFESNQITQVLQKGYLLNGRVIRPAMVMVAA
ncbi:nucleotide exchange factor GrpE [Pasteurellaceae bacterium HPA106]|uniref:nucleotide exchange factor GrpE n=1 Tax=Spirabiliibacterium pneumoniae TaxID=221400 RepID=UPI001AADD2D1|nr:nucleotide exchange factor GrpE [Spirabiliibacterium pneumoniae]MBE2895673.1 nucleotide exchange factor GrpE [Spirabiliibacterium pneumoniae]